MTNLTPERRADKNGKIVTRHVRTDQGVTATKKRLPAPVAKPEARFTKRQLVNITTAHATMAYYSRSAYDKLTLEDFTSKIKEHRPETLENYRAAVVDGNFDYMHLMMTVLSNSVASEEADYLLRIAKFDKDPEFDYQDWTGKSATHTFAEDIYKGLMYDGIVPSDLAGLDDKELEQVDAAIRITAALQLLDDDYQESEHLYSGAYVIFNKSLIHLAMRRSDRMEEIIQMLPDLSKEDGSRIEEILDFEVQSLRDGVL